MKLLNFVSGFYFCVLFFSLSAAAGERADLATRPFHVTPAGQPDCLNVRADEMPLDTDPFISNPQIDENMPSMLGRIKRILKQGRKFSVHRQALDASALIYKLADLETAVSGAEFVKQYNDFFQNIPAGYALYYASSDPVYGLKYAILNPIIESIERPWILTIAGTQTAKDWIIDTDLGRKQLTRLSQLFTKCLFQDSQHRMLFDRKLLVTGHSLGGGLAQAIAYEMERRLIPVMPADVESPLTLVTWNAFGAQELVQRVGTFRPEITKSMDLSNYYVRGDLVSKIGHHIGATFELVPFDPIQLTEQNLGVKDAHIIETIFRVVGADPYNLKEAAEQVPPFADNLTYLSKLGPLFKPVTSVYYYARRPRLLEVLKKSMSLTADAGLKNPGALQLVAYIKQLAFDENERMLHDGQSLNAEAFLRDLRVQENRLYRAP